MARNPNLMGAAIALVCLIWSNAAGAACAQIKTPADLNNVRNNLAGSYCLANDIDMGSFANFMPIGGDTTGFTGKFDGKNHVIRNLTVHLPASSHVAGLFASLDCSALVQNVSVENVDVANAFGGGYPSGSGIAGGLAGHSLIGSCPAGNAVLIKNVHVSGLVSITCDSVCYAGGIIGVLGPKASLLRSASSADVSAANTTSAFFLSSVGGAVGVAEGPVGETYATGSVSCGPQCIGSGGLIGEFVNPNSGVQPVLQDSHATGPVTTGDNGYAGGLIGRSSGNVSILTSHALGPVSGGASAHVAGLIGRLETGQTATLTQAYAAGPVSGGAGAQVGGLMADISGTATITYCYWDKNTTGQGGSSAGIGLTTTQLRAKLRAGFDGVGTHWLITKAYSYPFIDPFSSSFSIDFAAPLATQVVNNNVFTVMPISQLDTSQYNNEPLHAGSAALAAVYTMIARAVGITDDVPKLKDVGIDKYFWNDATKTVAWTGPVTNYATLGTLQTIGNLTHLNKTVVSQLKLRNFVILHAYDSASRKWHWMLATLFTTNADGTVHTVVALDPWTGLQVHIDPATKQVVLPANFPLELTVKGYQPVTLN